MRTRDWAVALAMVLVAKQLYSQAGAAQLQWLLWPLAQLLNTLTPLEFRPLASGHWLDARHDLVIVEACAGGNFLLTSWLLWLWRWGQPSSPVASTVAVPQFGLSLALRACAAAWLVTLMANALRIVLLVYGQDDLARLAGLSAADSHRLIGIAVYFLCLCAQLIGWRYAKTGLVAATALYLVVNLLMPQLRAWVLGLDNIPLRHIAWTAGLPLVALFVWTGWRMILWRAGRVPLSAGPFLATRSTSPPVVHELVAHWKRWKFLKYLPQGLRA